MDEKHRKVNNIEICDWCLESRRERPRKSHDEVTTIRKARGAFSFPEKRIIDVQVIWVTRSPPPARREQLGSLLRRKVFQVYLLIVSYRECHEV